MTFVRAMIQGSLRLGHDPSPSLRGAHIEPDAVTQINGWITASQMERLSDHLMRALDDEALGWFHRRLPWGSYGMLARASLTAPTLRVALQRWCRHHQLLTDDIVIEFEESTLIRQQVTTVVGVKPSVARVRLVEQHTGPWLVGELRVFSHVSLLRNLMGFAGWLVDSRLPLGQASFAFSSVEAERACCSTLFHALRAPLYDQPHTVIEWPGAYLDLPLVRDETAMRQMLAHALPLVVRGYRPDRLLIQRIHHLFRNQPATLRNANQLASALHVSVRSLHRELQAHNTTLQTLKDSFRCARFDQLRHNSGWPLKKIASALGYASDKGLIRATRKWGTAALSEDEIPPPMVS